MLYTDPWLNADERRRIEIATSFPQLVEIAIGVIARNRKPNMPVVQVCGPMASGGGKLEENTAKITHAILELRRKGRIVFSQVSFQTGMLNFMTLEDYQRNPLELLDGFYGKLFRGGHIQELVFLSGWEGSYGCRWEHTTGKELGINISFRSPIIPDPA